VCASDACNLDTVGEVTDKSFDGVELGAIPALNVPTVCGGEAIAMRVAIQAPNAPVYHLEPCMGQAGFKWGDAGSPTLALQQQDEEGVRHDVHHGSQSGPREFAIEALAGIRPNQFVAYDHFFLCTTCNRG